jgi:6-phosphogluconolactonase
MLAGGSTPEPAYRRLASADLAPPVAWSAVSIYFGDERCVPPEDPESNYGMVKRVLLDALAAPPAAVHRMRGEDPDPARAAAAYAALLPEHVDVLVLGMGADGHTASLFPGSPALAEERRRVMAVTGPKPPARRLTITPPVIRAARAIIVLVAGAEKAAVAARVLGPEGAGADLPAALARHGIWILDRAAGMRSQP